ncbi:hypothetical protein [Rhizobium sp. YTU87027]
MTKTAFICAVFAGYVAVMLSLAAIPGEMDSEVSQARAAQAVN